MAERGSKRANIVRLIRVLASIGALSSVFVQSLAFSHQTLAYAHYGWPLWAVQYLETLCAWALALLIGELVVTLIGKR